MKARIYAAVRNVANSRDETFPHRMIQIEGLPEEAAGSPGQEAQRQALIACFAVILEKQPYVVYEGEIPYDWT